MEMSKPQRVWTVAEAKTHLSKILRLAEVEGPQRIGTPTSVRCGGCRGVGRENVAP